MHSNTRTARPRCAAIATQTLEHLPMPLAILDSEGHLELANGPFRARFGREGRGLPLAPWAHRAGSRWTRVTLPASSPKAEPIEAHLIAADEHVLVAFGAAPGSASTDEIAALHHQIASLQHRASTDPLTGAWNRAHFS